MYLVRTNTKMALQQANAAATAAQIAYFRAIPWCAAHLSSLPDLVIDQAVSRRLSHSARDTLLSRTLNRPDAIPAYITFYSPSSSISPPSLIREVKSFLALGPMLNGWEGICHGGMVVTLLDEVMGQVFAVNKTLGRMEGNPVMTGYLNTRFEKPVRTGGAAEKASVVMVTGRLVRQEGRKYWMEGDVQGEGGVVLARAESLFVMLRGKL
ncbi:acyl-coenzyme A thioesterase THEM4 [Chaetomidium leptoderma]|uniref:Acyl-coenzyme A thioesterase THEM4 n=1 Tax=Chaetomidium leptoderma TaxID=669021 RepID=A0AAN6VHY3_9PEZI|nr:acyl-coenzyme A thioesterase THEM4 [Chaetomidium leptoderma]